MQNAMSSERKRERKREREREGKTEKKLTQALQLIFATPQAFYVYRFWAMSSFRFLSTTV